MQTRALLQLLNISRNRSKRPNLYDSEEKVIFLYVCSIGLGCDSWKRTGWRVIVGQLISLSFFFFVKPFYLILPSEIISVERWGLRGWESGWSCTTTTTLLHNDRCTVDLSPYNLGSDCAIPACCIFALFV